MEVFLRIIGLVLAMSIIIWLLFRWVANRELYKRGSLRKDLMVSSLLWCLAVVVGQIEQLFDTGTYIRVAFTLGALLTTISILVRPNQEWIKNTEG